MPPPGSPRPAGRSAAATWAGSTSIGGGGRRSVAHAASTRCGRGRAGRSSWACSPGRDGDPPGDRRWHVARVVAPGRRFVPIDEVQDPARRARREHARRAPHSAGRRRARRSRRRQRPWPRCARARRARPACRSRLRSRRSSAKPSISSTVGGGSTAAGRSPVAAPALAVRRSRPPGAAAAGAVARARGCAPRRRSPGGAARSARASLPWTSMTYTWVPGAVASAAAPMVASALLTPLPRLPPTSRWPLAGDQRSGRWRWWSGSSTRPTIAAPSAASVVVASPSPSPSPSRVVAVAVAVVVAVVEPRVGRLQLGGSGGHHGAAWRRRARQLVRLARWRGPRWPAARWCRRPAPCSSPSGTDVLVGPRRSTARPARRRAMVTGVVSPTTSSASAASCRRSAQRTLVLARMSSLTTPAGSLRGEHEVHAEAATALGDADERMEERRLLADQRGELVDHHHEPWQVLVRGDVAGCGEVGRAVRRAAPPRGGAARRAGCAARASPADRRGRSRRRPRAAAWRRRRTSPRPCSRRARRSAARAGRARPCRRPCCAAARSCPNRSCRRSARADRRGRGRARSSRRRPCRSACTGGRRRARRATGRRCPRR